GFDGAAQPASRLVKEAVFEVAYADRAERALGKIDDLSTLRWPFAGDEVQLIIAVEMHLVGPVAELPALLQFLDDIGIARCGNEGRKPIEPRHQPVLHLARRHPAGPAHHAGHAKAAFQHRTLAASKRRLTAIRPCKILGAIVGGEDNYGILFNAK